MLELLWAAKKKKTESVHSAWPLGLAESWYWCVCLCVCLSVCLSVCLTNTVCPHLLSVGPSVGRSKTFIVYKIRVHTLPWCQEGRGNSGGPQ